MTHTIYNVENRAKGKVTSSGSASVNSELDIRQTQQQSQAVAMNEGKYHEAARAQRLYTANTGAGTSIAPVTSMPTVTAAWALYNGSTSGKNLSLIKVWAHSTGGTLGLGMSLLVTISQTAQATVPSAYASSVSSALTPGSTATAAVFAQNVTLAQAPSWVNVASRDQVSAVSIGSGIVADVDEMFLIPPGHALGATVLAADGTSPLFSVGFLWREYTETLG